jgi:hypothetical protein
MVILSVLSIKCLTSFKLATAVEIAKIIPGLIDVLSLSMPVTMLAKECELVIMNDLLPPEELLV